MIDSATIVSEIPANASPTDNVRKCPVLSGSTDCTTETDASPNSQTTCRQNPSCPDQTSTGHQPHPAPQPEPDILYELTARQLHTIDLLLAGQSIVKIAAI